MTREEASNILDDFDVNFAGHTAEEIAEAFDVAFKALSQEPTKREIEREYLFQSLCEDFKKLQAENDDLRKRLEQDPCDDAISREAVLKGIEELKKSPWATANRSHGYEYLITEALDVVKDLCVKQAPSVTPQPCDDAISRDALKKMLMKLDKWHVKNKQFVNVGLLYDDVFFGIEHLPSVTQKSETVTEFADRCRECGAKYGKLLEQKSGKWIELPKALDLNENPCKCSACGHILSFMHGYPKSNYCPNCGAKMEREDKE